MMLQKYITWRLWNQMFQYATLRAFQIKNGLQKESIKLDFSEQKFFHSKCGDGWYDQLMYFNTVDYEIWEISPKIIQKILINFEKLITLVISIAFRKNYKKYTKILSKVEMKLQKLYNRFWLYFFSFWWCEFLNNSKINDRIFFGLFESPKYFDFIKPIIEQEFTPRYGILVHNLWLYEDIEKSESVCVSIRRWDFVENENNKKLHYVCTPWYFYRWIDYIQKKVPNAKFFIFSDDIDWCKNNMQFPEWTQFENGWDPVWEKLRLMYSCKHFVISNSTFSWWAQYLSRNNKKIVCAPSRWLNPDFYPSDYDIYEKWWILIDP